MYYVYILFRPDGRPFYVGKGQRNRMHQHEIEARRGCACHKCNTIRKVWAEGGQVFKSKVFQTHYEADAYQMEARIINAIGLQLLANVKEGGIPDSIRPRFTQPQEWIAWLAQHTTQAVSPEQAEETRNRALLAKLEYAVHQRRYWYARKLTPKQIDDLDAEIDAYREVLRPLLTGESHHKQEGFDF